MRSCGDGYRGVWRNGDVREWFGGVWRIGREVVVCRRGLGSDVGTEVGPGDDAAAEQFEGPGA